jgi:hypothetical protein
MGMPPHSARETRPERADIGADLAARSIRLPRIRAVAAGLASEPARRRSRRAIGCPGVEERRLHGASSSHDGILRADTESRQEGAMAATPMQVPELDASFEALVRDAAGDAGAVRIRLRTWLANAEAWRIREALRECNGNRTKAAQRLGIGRRTLYNKMEKLCLVPRWTG